MAYTAAMVDDFYDASADLVWASTGAAIGTIWVAPGAYAFCEARAITACDVDGIASYLKSEGVTIQNILVGDERLFTPTIQARMAALSSCPAGAADGCPFFERADDFAALEAAAGAVAAGVADTVATVTRVVATTTQVTTQVATTTQQTVLEERTEERTVAVSTTEPVVVRKTETVQETVEVETPVVTERETTKPVVTQKDVCTGSGASFAFLLLGLPLLAYVFLKPFLNCAERALCPAPAPTPGPADAQSPCEMFANPVFGFEMPANDAEPRAFAAPVKKARGAIDRTRMKRAGARKKKKTRFGGGDDLAVDEPAGTAALPPSPVSPDAVTIDAPTPKAAAPPVFGRHQSTTEWTSGLGAVYDGDDWQERVADAVLDLLFCRCRAKRPDPDQPKADPRAAQV